MANPLKAGLAAGRVQLGTWINLVRNPAILSLLKAAGLDYARVDMEHSSPSIETVARPASGCPGGPRAGARLPDRRAPVGGEPRVDHAAARCRGAGATYPVG